MRGSAVMAMLLAALGTTPAAAGDGPAPRPAVQSLRRVVRHFDFEENERAPLEFPLSWYRHVAHDEGFPPFGRMAPADDAAAGGRWSFRFDLGGGSLSARVADGVLPVMPEAAHRVSVSVRTEGLHHARARLVAWLHGRDEDALPGSLVASPAVAGSDWRELAVVLGPAPPEAVGLVVELQVIQPAHLAAGRAAADGPRPQDVRGHAWFDDVVVRRLPRVEMTTGVPGEVAIGPRPPAVRLVVDDLAREPLAATLALVDFDGRRRDLGPVPTGARPAAVPLPLDRHGWYRVVLEVTDAAGLVDRRTLDLAWLPDERRSAGRSTLAVSVPPQGRADLALLPDLVARLGVERIVLPAGPPPGIPDDALRAEALRGAIDRLLDDGVEPVVGLPVAAGGLDGALTELMVNFGLRVRRWRIDDRHAPVDAVARLRAAVANYVADPIVYAPRAADDPAPAGPADRSVPASITPTALGPLAAGWAAGGRDTVMITLATGPEDSATTRSRARTLVLRTLAARRAGLEHVAIPAPWRADAEGLGAVRSDPAFAVWRQLGARLAGRRFAGELDFAAGVRCWVLEGRGPRGSALVLWRDDDAGGTPTDVAMNLGGGAIEAIDPWGNREPLPLRDDRHELSVGDEILFVEPVDLELTRFRAAVRIEPPFAPAAHRVHEHEIVLENPWDVRISGTLRLRDLPQWRLTPRSMSFAIDPGGETRLPVSIVFPRSVTAGVRRLDAEIEVEAEDLVRLRTQPALRIGWPGVEFSAEWRREGPDLVVTHTVTNRGPSAVNLDAWIQGRGIARRQRPVGALPPGVTAVRTFRLEGGAALLAGTTLRVGVSERQGPMRLNDTIHVPAGAGDTGEAVASGDE
ncbi:MAG: hypothetical protein ACYTG1_00415 [Planctomycetota bacterium]|jgi:hypothetical protein